jgi:hypothetical protein
MISTFNTLLLPSQAVVGLATVGLLVILVSSVILENLGTQGSSVAHYLRVFSIPLLILFVMVVLVHVFRVIA